MIGDISIIDKMFEYIKIHPEAKIECFPNPKSLCFKYKIDGIYFDLRLSTIKRNTKKYSEFIYYIKLSLEERIIKNIIE
jgi:hypothetical protein